MCSELRPAAPTKVYIGSDSLRPYSTVSDSIKVIHAQILFRKCVYKRMHCPQPTRAHASIPSTISSTILGDCFISKTPIYLQIQTIFRLAYTAFSQAHLTLYFQGCILSADQRRKPHNLSAKQFQPLLSSYIPAIMASDTKTYISKVAYNGSSKSSSSSFSPNSYHTTTRKQSDAMDRYLAEERDHRSYTVNTYDPYQQDARRKHAEYLVDLLLNGV